MDGLGLLVPILWDLPRGIRDRGVAVEDTGGDLESWTFFCL